MPGLIGDLVDANSRRGVSYYSPTRPMARPQGTANAGTARRIIGSQLTGGSAAQAPRRGMSPLRAMAADVQSRTPGEAPEVGGWRGALGTVVNSAPGKALMGAMSILDAPHRIVISGMNEAADLFNGGDAGWDDFVGQVMDSDFSFSDVVGSTGNRWLDAGIGFVGDVLTDPLTYVAGAGVISGVGRTSRAGLAARMLEAGLDNELAQRVGRLGLSSLDDAERTLVREAIGAGVERGALTAGGEQILDRGYYWKTPFVDGYHRLPGTGQLDRLVGGAFARTRSRISQTRLMQATFGKIGDAEIGEALRRITTGRGSLGFEEAAELLNTTQAHRYGMNMAKREAKQARIILSKEASDSALNAMIDTAEERGGTAINKFFGRLGTLLDDLGVRRGDVTNYVPHYYTDQGKKWLTGRDPKAVQFREVFKDNLFEDVNPSMMERSFKARPGQPYNINGRDFNIEKGTIAEINREFRKVTGLDFDVLETDFRKIADRYVAGFGEEVGTMTAAKRLRASRSGLTRTEREANIEYVVQEAIDKTANEKTRKGLARRLAAAKAARESFEADMVRDVNAVSNLLRQRFMPVIDELTMLGDKARADLTGALDRYDAVQVLRGGVPGTAGAPGRAQGGSLLENLEASLLDIEQTVADIAQRRSALAERARIEAEQAPGILYAAQRAGGAERRRAAAREFGDLTQKLIAAQGDHARLLDMQATVQRAMSQAQLAADVSQNTSFLATALPHEVGRDVARMQAGPRAVNEIGPEDVPIESVADVYNRGAVARAKIVDPRVIETAGYTRVRGVKTDVAELNRLNEHIRIDLAPKAARARQQFHAVASAQARPLAAANEHLRSLRTIEAQTEAWLERMAGRPELVDVVDENQLWLDHFRSEAGELGRAVSSYDARRKTLDDAKEVFDNAQNALEEAQRQQVAVARRMDERIERYRQNNPLEAADLPPLPLNETQLVQARGKLRADRARARQWAASKEGQREQTMLTDISKAEKRLAKVNGEITQLEGGRFIDDDGNVQLVGRTAQAQRVTQVRNELSRESRIAYEEYLARIADAGAATDDAARQAAASAAEAARLHWREIQGPLDEANKKVLHYYEFDPSFEYRRVQRLRQALEERIELDSYIKGERAYLEEMRAHSGIDVVRRRIASNTQRINVQDAAVTARREALAAGVVPRSDMARRLEHQFSVERGAVDDFDPPGAYKTAWGDVPRREATIGEVTSMSPQDAAAWEGAMKIIREAETFGGEDSPLVRQARQVITELRGKDFPTEQIDELTQANRFATLEGQLDEIRDIMDPWVPTPEQREAITQPLGLRKRGGATRAAKGKSRSAAYRETQANLARAKRASRIAKYLDRDGLFDDLISRGALRPAFADHVRSLQRDLEFTIRSYATNAAPFMSRRLEQASVDMNLALEYSLRMRAALATGAEAGPKVSAYVGGVVLGNYSEVLDSKIRGLQKRIALRDLGPAERKAIELSEQSGIELSEAFREALLPSGKIRGLTRDDTQYELRRLQLASSIQNDERTIQEILTRTNYKPTGDDKGALRLARRRVKRNGRKLEQLEMPTYGMVSETVDALHTAIYDQVALADGHLTDYNFYRHLTFAKDQAVNNQRRLRANQPMLVANVEAYSAEQDRLVEAIKRAARGGKTTVRWRPSRTIEREMPVEDAAAALARGEFPEHVARQVRSELESNPVTEGLAGASDRARATSGIEANEPFAGEMTGLSPEERDAILQQRHQARFQQRREMNRTLGREEAAAEYGAMYGDQPPIEPNWRFAEDPERAGWAPSPTGRTTGHTIKVRYVVPLDRNGMRTLPIDEARALADANAKALESLRVSIERNEMTLKVMDGSIVDEIANLRAVIEDAMDPPDLEQLQRTANEIMNRAQRGGRELDPGEVALVQRVLGRAERIRSGNILTGEDLEKAKQHLARMEAAYDNHLEAMGDSYLTQRSMIDGGVDFLTELVNGTRPMNRETAYLMSSLLGASEAPVAQMMSMRFNELFGAAHEPITRREITTISERIGPPPILPRDSMLSRLVNSGRDPSMSEVRAAADDARRALDDFRMMEMGGVDVGDVTQKMETWISALDYIADPANREIAWSINEMSNKQIAEAFQEFFNEFGESDLTSAMRQVAVEISNSGGDAAEVIAGARGELIKALTAAADVAARDEMRETTTLARNLGLGLSSADPTQTGRLAFLGYTMGTQDFDPQQLRQLLIDGLTRKGMDLTDTAQAKLQQQILIKARVDAMRRGLGRDIALSRTQLTPEQIAELLERRAREAQGDPKSLKAFNRDLATFMEVTAPDDVTAIFDRRLDQLNDRLDAAKASKNTAEIAAINEEMNDLAMGARPGEPAIPEMPAAAVEAPDEGAINRVREELSQATAEREAAATELADRRASVGQEPIPLVRPDETPTGYYSEAEIQQAYIDMVNATRRGENVKALRREHATRMDLRWTNEPTESVEAARSIARQNLGAFGGDLSEYEDALETASQRVAELTRQLDEMSAAAVPGAEQLDTAASMTGDAVDDPFASLQRFNPDDEAASFDEVSQELAEVQRLLATDLPEDAKVKLASRARRLIAMRNERSGAARTDFLTQYVPDMKARIDEERRLIAEGRQAALDPEHLLTQGTPSVGLSQPWLGATGEDRVAAGMERFVTREGVRENLTLRTTPSRGALTAGSWSARARAIEKELAPAMSLRDEMYAAAARSEALAERAQRQLDAFEAGRDIPAEVQAAASAAAAARKESLSYAEEEAARDAVWARQRQITVEHHALNREQEAQRLRKVAAMRDYNSKLTMADAEAASLRNNILDASERVRQSEEEVDQLVDSIDLLTRQDNSLYDDIVQLRKANDLRKGPVVQGAGGRAADPVDIAQIAVLLDSAARQSMELARLGFNEQVLQGQLDNFAKNAPKVAEVIKYKVADGWLPLTDRLATGPEAVFITKELHSALSNIVRATENPDTWKMIKTFTEFFKTYATATPGFHVRNFISGVFMNLVDGVKIRNMHESRGIWRDFMKDPFGYIERVGRNSREGQALSLVFASGAAGQFDEVAEAMTAKTLLLNNAVTRLNQRTGANVEGMLRLSMALDSLDRGQSLASAMERIVKFHFDYSTMGTMDPTMRKLVPFWTFMSRNLPLQLESMFTRPRAYAVYRHFVDNFGQPVDPLTPDYWLSQGAFTLVPGQGEGEMTGSVPYWAPDLPFTRMLEPFEGGLPNVLSNLNPLMLAPAEAFGFKKKLYTGAPLEGYSAPEGAMDWLTPIFEMLGQTKVGGTSGDTLVSESAQHLARTLLPPLNLAERLTSSEGVRAGRQGETLARALGAPVYTLTDPLREQTRRGNYYDQLDALERMRELARS